MAFNERNNEEIIAAKAWHRHNRIVWLVGGIGARRHYDALAAEIEIIVKQTATALIML